MSELDYFSYENIYDKHQRHVCMYTVNPKGRCKKSKYFFFIISNILVYYSDAVVKRKLFINFLTHRSTLPKAFYGLLVLFWVQIILVKKKKIQNLMIILIFNLNLNSGILTSKFQYVYKHYFFYNRII